MLKINEIFETIQGEAQYTGTPSVFIRLQGCEVGCAFCDTKHTWEMNPKIIPIKDMAAKVEDEESCAMMTEEEIVEFVIANFSAKHIVITGGEPCIYNLIELTDRFLDHGYSTQIETSGTEPILCADETFVTLSPKYNMAGGKEVLVDNYMRADEVKMPVGKQSDIDLIHTMIVPHHDNIWLQPVSQSKKATQLCIDTATKNNWRISIQTHKFINIR
jgi:7-carboxy-7-deazaguanine synthase